MRGEFHFQLVILFYFLPLITSLGIPTKVLVNVTSKQRQNIVDMHNFYRRSADPIASNMMYMVWNHNLAVEAQRWANNCRFEYGLPPGLNVTQNIHKSTGEKNIVVRAIDGWAHQGNYYDFNTNICTNSLTNCLFYKKMVWGPTNKIGCGITHCPKWELLVCNYSPASENYVAVRPYIAGNPCTLCENLENCLFGLCVLLNGDETHGSKPFYQHEAGNHSAQALRRKSKPNLLKIVFSCLLFIFVVLKIIKA